MSTISPRSRTLLMAAFGLAVFLYLSYWAGFPSDLIIPFIIGLVLFAVFLAGYGWLGYHLLARPLPEGHKNPSIQMLPAINRRFLAIVLGICGLGLSVGGTWDEVWHRMYGIPFGEDFFWRPHILIYIGMLTPPLLAIISLFGVIRGKKGSIQQKLRADPALAFLIIVGLLLAMALPADPLWHFIYGNDLSAWSLPHLVLLICASSVMLVAAFTMLTTLKPQEWRGIWRASPETWIIILCVSLSLMFQIQLNVNDWESASPMTQLRPFWLLPALIVLFATFSGNIANRITRTFGAASAAAIIAIAIRWALIKAFDYEVPIDAWLFILPPVAGLDVWHAIQARMNYDDNPIVNSIAVNLPMALFSFPLINQLYPYLHLTGINMVITLLVCILVGAAAAWTGQAIGERFWDAPRDTEIVSESAARLRVTVSGIFAAAIVFIVIFIFTATPPV